MSIVPDPLFESPAASSPSPAMELLRDVLSYLPTTHGDYMVSDGATPMQLVLLSKKIREFLAVSPAPPEGPSITAVVESNIERAENIAYDISVMPEAETDGRLQGIRIVALELATSLRALSARIRATAQ